MVWFFGFSTWSLAQIRCLRGTERGFTTDSRRIGDHVRKDVRMQGYCGSFVASRGGVTAKMLSVPVDSICRCGQGVIGRVHVPLT